MKRFRVRVLIAGAVLGLGFDCGGISFAAELEKALSEHPDPSKAAYYVEHASQIEQLRTKTKSGTAAARLEGLEQLSIDYPDAVQTTAIDLINDTDTQVAQAAAERLAAAVVMSNHHHVPDPANLTAYQTYAMGRHDEARAALRGALADPRREVREVAATSLASLSDEQAIQLIDQGIKQGRFSEVEGVNYLGLADPESGAKYIQPYLTAKSAEARAGAVAYLGANSSYQALVRDTILLNKAAPPETRAEAATVLSTYDSRYRSYAVDLAVEMAKDPKASTEVFTGVVKGYLTSQRASAPLDPAELQKLRTAVENYAAKQPRADLEAITQSIRLQPAAPGS